MKKQPMIKYLLAFLLALVSGFTASAQITITQSDVASVGTVVLQARDTLPAPGIGPGPSGANVTWNLAALDTHTIDTLTFTNPAWTPYGSSFPSSNLAVQISSAYSPNIGYAYLDNASSGLWLQGQGDATYGAVDQVPDELIFPFPATYGTSYTNTSSFTVKGPYTATGVDSVRYKSTVSKTGNVDAWGTLITPLGSFNTIRSREAQTKTDSVWVHTTGPFPPAAWYFFSDSVETLDHYVWWANGVGFPLVEMDSSANGISEVAWLLASPVITGLASLSPAENGHLYPNPASDNINVHIASGNAAKFLIFDPTGRLIKTSDLSGAATTIAVNDLSAGIYFYMAAANDGSILQKGKFTVKR
jgi:hypothetical protein